MTNWASLCTQPRQHIRMDYIFHRSEEGDSAVPGVITVLDIIKDMGKEEIICVQYHHKCSSIFTLKKIC